MKNHPGKYPIPEQTPVQTRKLSTLNPVLRVGRTRSKGQVMGHDRCIETKFLYSTFKSSSQTFTVELHTTRKHDENLTVIGNEFKQNLHGGSMEADSNVSFISAAKT